MKIIISLRSTLAKEIIFRFSNRHSTEGNFIMRDGGGKAMRASTAK